MQVVVTPLAQVFGLKLGLPKATKVRLLVLNGLSAEEFFGYCVSTSSVSKASAESPDKSSKARAWASSQRAFCYSPSMFQAEGSGRSNSKGDRSGGGGGTDRHGGVKSQIRKPRYPLAGKGALTVNEFVSALDLTNPDDFKGHHFCSKVARTKRYRERGLEPTKPELIAYARRSAQRGLRPAYLC